MREIYENIIYIISNLTLLESAMREGEARARYALIRLLRLVFIGLSGLYWFRLVYIGSDWFILVQIGLDWF